MPLVFVHGVNTRRGETTEQQRVYDNRVEFAKQQFREIAFKDRCPDLEVFAPYWGDLGVVFARNLASIPHGELQTLGIASSETAAVEETTSAHLDAELGLDDDVRNRPILTLARRRGLRPAVNLLFAGASAAPLDPLVDQAQHRMPQAARLALAAEVYAERTPAPPWLVAVQTDEAFVERLLEELARNGSVDRPELQSLAVGSALGNWLQNAATAVGDAARKVVNVATGAVVGGLGGVIVGATVGAGDTASRHAFVLASRYLRPAASTFIGRFFGDVFTYMDDRTAIARRVLDAIDRAAAARDRSGSRDTELVLVGHSFGGIILFDILTHFRPHLRCELLVTVGSQVGLFAEMGRFANQPALDAAFAAGKPAARPDNIERWINVYDVTDYVGFGVKDVFTGVSDFAFEADAYPIVSHGAYFDTPNFYVRLRERVAEAFAEGV
jgi:hypothetical protein